MSITIETTQIRKIGKSCLRKDEIITVSNAVDKLSSCRTEDELVELARKMVNLKDRNEHIRDNEYNIDLVKKLLKKELGYGDKFTIQTLWQGGEFHFKWDGVKRRAITEAIRDLIKDGFLISERVARTDVRCRFNKVKYETVYTVVE